VRPSDSWSGRQLRRVATAPVVILATLLIGVTLPLWLVAAAALSPVLPGRWRPLRLLWVVILYLVCESLLLVILFGLWISSGFGARIRTPYFEGIHYDLVQGVLWIFFREARRVLNLTIETAGPSPEAHPGKPLLVCCRHAGPGDSFTLIYALMHWYDREPRVVLKDTLAWDPVIDVVLHRIPARFISPDPRARDRATESIERVIAELATGLDENDAFVIFPEGGNFTPRRRERAIERLHKMGMHRMAKRAEAMTNVLAPRPGGFLAALDAAPDADVVMVAHTGMDHLLTVGDVWRELPMDKRLLMQWWQVPRAEIPRERDDQIDWLFGWWERIDVWIDEHRAEDLPLRGGRVAGAVGRRGPGRGR
jgi:1-acyl-sn-glycerol-3-phosphate acyltransferase